MIDLQSDFGFARRQPHVREAVSHIEGLNRLARVFVESPSDILQQLVTAAVELCGADSAGISVDAGAGEVCSDRREITAATEIADGAGKNCRSGGHDERSGASDQ